jgi:dynein axonemal light chain 1
MSNNRIKNFDELSKLSVLPHLEDLLLVGNPIYENLSTEESRKEVISRLPNLKKLDGDVVTEAERAAATGAE